ncbi:hypothetical protein [Coraliomargarita parva]|uniref:hypothetical protein n=1 Tax=Coraliomargarita parva TaxID=3014050 RepID=UPI0022B49B9B|nr:hypothetical protein [Coraliomargarita parva]
MSEDDSHLNALSIAHYIMGGIGVFFACFPLIHMSVGLMILTGVIEANQAMGGDPSAPPELFGWFFFLMGLAFFLAGQAVSISLILSGRFIRHRRKYMFSFVLACVACAFAPFGTVLGVFTLMVLSRSSVKTLYGRPGY